MQLSLSDTQRLTSNSDAVNVDSEQTSHVPWQKRRSM